MMAYSKSTTLNGMSFIKDEQGKELRIASMVGVVKEDGTPTITHAINDKELFAENKDTVLADFSSFDQKVYEVSFSFLAELNGQAATAPAEASEAQEPEVE